ncbi:MAG: ATP-binding protein [Nitrospiraceae bacterium]|nr:ATP-binding protein [Nitrospiraceae bacterium]
MQDISLHILDIIQNSIDAGATEVRISIQEETASDFFRLVIADNGRGMSMSALQKAADPFYTTKSKKFGLGIPFLAQSASETGGSISINSNESNGTVIEVTMKPGHIDMRPLGDIGSTMMTLVASCPDTRFMLEYARNGYSFTFDTDELRKELDGVPLNFPAALKHIKETINSAVLGSNE